MQYNTYFKIKIMEKRNKHYSDLFDPIIQNTTTNLKFNLH